MGKGLRQRRRVRQQTKGNKAVSNAYAMRAWLDLDQPMPIRTLSIDDVLSGLFEQYRMDTGRPVPLEVACKCVRLVDEAKANYQSRPHKVQTAFWFLKEKVKDILEGETL